MIERFKELALTELKKKLQDFKEVDSKNFPDDAIFFFTSEPGGTGFALVLNTPEKVWVGRTVNLYQFGSSYWVESDGFRMDFTPEGVKVVVDMAYDRIKSIFQRHQ